MTADLKRVNLTWPNSRAPACANASLKIAAGTVHALVGENGAGKTTLGHILAGVLQPDTGELEFNEKAVNLVKNSNKALPGIGLVRQQNIWPATLYLWEAIILGRGKIFHRPSVVIDAFHRCTSQWKIPDLNPKERVGNLDAAALQQGELVAALMTDPQIIILDEPVDAWEGGRKEEFYTLMHRFRECGMGVLFITHHLDDVFRMADYLTVMRHGHIVNRGPVDQFDSTEIMRLMFPEDPGSGISDASPQRSRRIEPVALCCEELSVKKAGKKELHDINFSLRHGEILGITGMRREGLLQLEDIISGRMAPSNGRMMLEGKSVRGGTIGIRVAGLGYVPSNALKRGASLKSTVAENMIILAAGHIACRGWLSPEKVREWAETRCIRGGIKGSANQILATLSRGNIQKLIVQRETDYAKSVLLLVDPTMNLDVRIRLEMIKIIKEAACRGIAVLLLTTNLDEALELTDQMAVITRGRLSPVKPTREWDRHEVSTRIAGIWKGIC